MGQAKQRGSLEERKAKAIEEGRAKVEVQRISRQAEPFDIHTSIALISAMLIAKNCRRR